MKEWSGRGETYGRSTNIPHHSAVNHIVERAHNLLLGRFPIQPMDLQHIDIRPQSPHTLLHLIKDILPTQPLAINPQSIVLAHLRNVRLLALFQTDPKVRLAEDDKRGARDLVLLDGFADDFFGAPVGVHVGGVPGVDAEVVGVL